MNSELREPASKELRMRFTQPVTHLNAHKAELGVLDPAWHTAILDVTEAAAVPELVWIAPFAASAAAMQI